LKIIKGLKINLHPKRCQSGFYCSKNISTLPILNAEKINIYSKPKLCGIFIGGDFKK